MSERLDDDWLSAAIDEFRAEARHAIRPPGAAEARRTVRRRSRSRAAVTLAVAAAVGLGVAGPLTTHRAPATPVGTTTPPAIKDVDALGVEALASLGFGPAGATPDGMLGVRPGIAYGGMRSATEPVVYRLGTADDPMPVGHYQLMAACRGQGRIAATWTTPDGATGGVTIGCDEPVSVPLTVSVPGVVVVSLRPDVSAAGRSGVAVVLTDPRVITARDRLGAPTAPISFEDVVAAPGYVVPMATTDHKGLDKGDYRLTLACVGEGSLIVRFILSGGDATTRVRCSAAGATTTSTARATAGGGLVSVQLTPVVSGRLGLAVACAVRRI